MMILIAVDRSGVLSSTTDHHSVSGPSSTNPGPVPLLLPIRARYSKRGCQHRTRLKARIRFRHLGRDPLAQKSAVDGSGLIVSELIVSEPIVMIVGLSIESDELPPWIVLVEVVRRGHGDIAAIS
jgi:hypothetical protein